MSQVTKIVNAYRLDDYAVVITLLPLDVQPGDVVNINDMPVALAGFEDNNALVVDCPQYRFLGVDTEGFLRFDANNPIANQVLYQNVGDDWQPSGVDPYGTITRNDVCTWVTNANVLEWLGIATATSNDTAFVTKCVSAANEFAFRRRQEAGYVDEKDTSPDGAVTLGTIMFAGTLYRERGSVDSFASFDSMGTFPVPGTLGRIMQLLGCGRPQVA